MSQTQTKPFAMRPSFPMRIEYPKGYISKYCLKKLNNYVCNPQKIKLLFGISTIWLLTHEQAAVVTHEKAIEVGAKLIVLPHGTTDKIFYEIAENQNLPVVRFIKNDRYHSFSTLQRLFNEHQGASLKIVTGKTERNISNGSTERHQRNKVTRAQETSQRAHKKGAGRGGDYRKFAEKFSK